MAPGELDKLIRQMATSVTAYHEAKRLKDPTLLPELASLCTSNDKKVRQNAYAAIGYIGANTGHSKAAMLLLRSCAMETNRPALLSALKALQELPQFPFAPILAKLVRQQDSRVRSAAIGALARCPGPRAENALLGVLRQSKRLGDLASALWSLRDIATPRSLPTMRRFIAEKRDLLRERAMRVMGRVGNASMQPIFLKALRSDRSPWVKEAALYGLRLHGDAAAVPDVLDRLTTVLSQMRKLIRVDRTEVNEAVEFLDHFRTIEPRITAVFKLIRTERVHWLSEDEKNELRRKVAFFANI